MSPRVSVCVPTYNRSKTLVHTIEAIIKQTFTDWEMVICDDGSSDDTQEVVKGFTDPRIRFYRNERNLGLYENWQRCIELAAGELVAIYHDHDAYLPSILEESVKTLDRFPTASFVHTAWFATSPERTISRLDLRPFAELTKGPAMVQILAHNWSSPVMAPTAIVRAGAYKKVGQYRYREYGLGCDLDMWLQLSRIGDAAYVTTPQALITERVAGQFTDIFRWSEYKKQAAMHRDHLELAHDGAPLQRRYQLAKFAWARDRLFLGMGMRSLFLESPAIVEEGNAVIRQHCLPVTSALYKTFCNSKSLQSLLTKTLWPRHRKQIGALLEERKRVVLMYLETEPELRQELLAAGFSLPSIAAQE